MLPTFLRKLPHLSASLEPRQHTQFTWLTDTLSRAEQHHALIHSHLDEKWHIHFATQFAHHLATSNALPACLKQAVCVYTDAYARAAEHHPAVSFASTENKMMVVTISLTGELKPDDTLLQMIRHRMDDPRWRFIFLAHPDIIHALSLPRHIYASTTLNTPSTTETLSLLKQECAHLEQFHQVSIPDEIPASALSLATRWLGGHSTLEKALQLLDSAAARHAVTADSPSTSVSTTTLTEITADWSGIPAATLRGNHFAAGPLLEALRQNIFGQDEAIYRIARTLQTHSIRLQTHQNAPLCHFLLIGPQYSGKSTLAAELAAYMTGHYQGLVRIEPSDTLDHLLTAVYNKPYAVILAENIEVFPVSIRLAIREILTTGHFKRQGHADVDFTGTIMILTCHTDTAQTIPLRALAPENTADLMHLVLGPQESGRLNPLTPSAEIPTESTTLLPPSFPDELKDLMRPISFMPLNLSALEKTVKKHTARIARTLQTRSGILLDVMPEVTRFLAQTLLKSSGKQPVERLLEQHLLPPLAHRLYESGENSARTERIKVRLNSSGQLLVCEWVSLQEMELH